MYYVLCMIIKQAEYEYEQECVHDKFPSEGLHGQDFRQDTFLSGTFTMGLSINNVSVKGGGGSAKC